MNSPRCTHILRSPSPGATWEGCMSSRPQLSPPLGYEHGMFENNSSLISRSQGGAAIACPSVLLVGRNGSWGTSVLRSLEKFECQLAFVAPQLVTPDYARNGAYNLILLDSSVSPEQRRQLSSELVSTQISIFYTFPVENGCWWLPTLHRGQNCYGAPAFRRNEFPHELERILQSE